MGIRHETSQVGDRYVMQKMMLSGAVLGGEDSGHMIFADLPHHRRRHLNGPQADRSHAIGKQTLVDLSKIMTVYPQVLMNVDVQSKPDIETVPEIVDAIQIRRIRIRGSGAGFSCAIPVPSRFAG